MVLFSANRRRCPHHNVVKEKRLEFFKTISRLRPSTKTIILIGPDHFSLNQNQISYTNTDWNLSNGQIFFNKNFPVTNLTLNNSVLKNDHTIYNLLPDLKTSFPKATLFPILIGQKIPVSNLDNLITQIKNNCSFNCLLIASVDFSHYLPSALADIHDTQSLKALNNLDLNLIPSLEVDSPQSLYILAKFSFLSRAQNWQLFAHTNSATISNNRDIESTSHIFGSYQKSIFPFKKVNNFTFTIASNLDRSQNQTSIGDRFFYGVDTFNPDLKFPFNPANNLIISGVINQDKTHLIFLPFYKKDKKIFFTVGDQKTKALTQFLQDFQANSKYTVDLFNGTLSYDTP